jgi:hypothetical protein
MNRGEEEVCPNGYQRTDGSGCSTIEYRHQERYETFTPKAEQLFVALFPARCNDTLTVTRMHGGGFNRIMGLTITPSKPSKYTLPWFQQGIKSLYGSCTRTNTRSAKLSEYILRAPRSPGEAADMEYDVAALQYAHRAVKLPIPKVVSYDSGAENALGQQYMIQERLPGRNGDEVWRDVKLTVQQRQSMVREIIRISQSMQAVTSDCAGTIKPTTDTTSQTSLVIEKLVPRIKPPPTEISVPQTTLECLLDIIARIEQREKNDDDFVLLWWGQLRKLFTSLHARGFLPDEDKFYFCHLDLYGRNILVSPSSESLAITGILDWDSEYAKFCPKFMAYRAPVWLWNSNERQAEKEELCDFEPKDEPAQALKLYWKSLAGEEWCRYAFTKEYQIARRAFNLLREGNWHFNEVDDIVAEWNQMYPDDDLEKDWPDDESDISDGESEGGDSEEEEFIAEDDMES